MESIRPLASQAAPSTLPTITKPNDSDIEQTKSLAEFSANSDAVILDASLGTQTSEIAKKKSKDENFQELYKALSLTGKEIVDKINEQLKVVLPDGIQSLKPQDFTPDATASRIVSGVTAFFDTYAKQNRNLSGEKLVDSFISEVQKGVTQGYGDAFKYLEGIGAFKVEGVQAGIEKTRSLIDEKLAAFAEQKKKDLGVTPPSESPKTGTVPTVTIDTSA